MPTPHSGSFSPLAHAQFHRRWSVAILVVVALLAALPARSVPARAQQAAPLFPGALPPARIDPGIIDAARMRYEATGGRYSGTDCTSTAPAPDAGAGVQACSQVRAVTGDLLQVLFLPIVATLPAGPAGTIVPVRATGDGWEAADPRSGPAPGSELLPEDASAEALAAAYELFDATTARCRPEGGGPAAGRARIVSGEPVINSTAELWQRTAERGLAPMGVVRGCPGGVARVVFGRTADRMWRYLGGDESLTVPLHLHPLPGNVRVCAGGDPLNVRAAPGTEAAVTGTLADGSVTQADEFVLTRVGEQSPVFAGTGWYRVGGSVTGWISADFAVDGRIEDCPRG